MHRSLSSLLLVAFAAFPIFAATPIPTAPAVDSRAYILVDYRTDKVLAASGPRCAHGAGKPDEADDRLHRV